MVIFNLNIKYLALVGLFLFASSAHSEEPTRPHIREKGVPKLSAPSSSPPSSNRFKSYASPAVSERNKGSQKGLEPSLSKNCSVQHSVDTYVQMTSASNPQADALGGVYFLSDLRERPQVFYLEKAGTWPTQITFAPEGVAEFQLSPKGQFLVYSTQEGGNEQYRLELLKIKTKEVEALVGSNSERVQSFQWAPSEDWLAFTSNRRNGVDFDLYRVELPTKKERLLTELSGHNQVSDISPNGQQIALFQYRSVTESNVFVFNQSKNTLSNITGKFGSFQNTKPLFAADNKHLFFLSDSLSELAQLQLVDLGGSNKPTLLTREKGEVEDVFLDSSRRHLIGIINQDGYAHFIAREVDSNGLFNKPLSVPLMKGSILSSPSFVPKKHGSDFFFSHTSSTAQRGIWLFRNGQTSLWTHSHQSALDPSCFASDTLVKYPSFDGLEIPAFLFWPKKHEGNKRTIPFVMYIHGGPEAQFRPSFSKLFQYFLQKGFGIFAPNIRGSTGYGRTYVSLDDYKKRMDSVQDTLAGARWLISKGYTSSTQLGIFGGSYGGFMVLRSIQEGGALFAAASESVGITDFVTFLKNTKPYRRALREAEYGPLSDESFLRSISPMNYLEKITTPLLIFHGANDPRVPVKETEQLVQSMKERGVPVEFKIFSDEGHGNTKLSNILEQARLTARFFENQFEVSNKKGSPE